MNDNDAVEAAAAAILAARLRNEGGRVDDVPKLMERVEFLVRANMESALLDATTVTGGPMILMKLSDLARPNTIFRCDGGEGEFLTCLECNMPWKMLKLHLLRTHDGMTPKAYREKHGLPEDAPMVAGKYSMLRSQLARDNGLGKRHLSKRPVPRKQGGAVKR